MSEGIISGRKKMTVMERGMVIEPLSKATLKGALETIKDAFPEEETEQVEFLSFSLSPKRKSLFNHLEFFVLIKDGSVIGVMGFGALRYEPEDIAWILYPAIRRSDQRHGQGTVLLGELVERARASGVKRLFADTSTESDDLGAKIFYGKAGFVRVGCIKPYFDDGSGLEYWMKEL